ncbi:uncharacterized protein LOC125941106 [Dermacentor silvarum]|uniref:uncharacterized protein LOC125941106 n=1 Tax=Dermacentor silvarum TaxID=543639 RepID=UPI00210141F6|nr:uncharacterized protein LOC125941106 [Dermacentor silvarum]
MSGEPRHLRPTRRTRNTPRSALSPQTFSATAASLLRAALSRRRPGAINRSGSRRPRKVTQPRGRHRRLAPAARWSFPKRLWLPLEKGLLPRRRFRLRLLLVLLKHLNLQTSPHTHRHEMSRRFAGLTTPLQRPTRGNRRSHDNRFFSARLYRSAILPMIGSVVIICLMLVVVISMLVSSRRRARAAGTDAAKPTAVFGDDGEVTATSATTNNVTMPNVTMTGTTGTENTTSSHSRGLVVE